ncbi:MAG: hypothetical protein ACQ9MH_13080 [Nitrospinales bacterium]
MAQQYIFPALGVFAGLSLYYSGFKELKSKRTIQDIPTSKIATGSVGTNVEIKGKIYTENDLLKDGPISNLPCAFYSLEIQKLVKTKDSSHWKSIDHIYSDKGFFVEDGSGEKALVLVEGAIIKRKESPEEFQISSNNFDEMPHHLLRELTSKSDKIKNFKIKTTSWFFAGRYRFLEWRFSPGEPVYILGYAGSGLKISKKEKLKLKYFMKGKKLIESDKKLKDRFDKNKDGLLSPDELEQGAKTIGKKLQNKYKPIKAKDTKPQPKMIFKKKSSYPFYISNMHETELVKSMGWLSTGKIWGGPIITIGCIAYLISLL